MWLIYTAVWRALPFCHGGIVASRPPHPNRWKCTQTIPTAPNTIGEHLKAKRLALHLFQSDVARVVGVHKGSIQNWERNVSSPMPGQMPAIIKFLGYVPFAHNGSVSGMIRWLRRCAGWTQEQFAAAAKCNGSTVVRWESGRPFDTRLWRDGIEFLTHQLQSLDLTELTKSELEALRNTVST